MRRPIKDDHRRQTDERLGGETRETLCLLLLYHNEILYLYTMSRRRRVTHYKTYDYNNVILKIPEGVAIISKWFSTITMTTVTALLQPSAHLTYFFIILYFSINTPRLLRDNKINSAGMISVRVLPFT